MALALCLSDQVGDRDGKSATPPITMSKYVLPFLHNPTTVKSSCQAGNLAIK